MPPRTTWLPVRTITCPRFFHLTAPRLRSQLIAHEAQKPAPKPPKHILPFAFAFDIDGVLLRSSKPLPNARRALRFLQRCKIPFILLTNGGGKLEKDRVSDLARQLQVPLDERDFIQSHTPFAELVHPTPEREGLKDKCILVTGGDGDKAREVAEAYGFRNVISPADIYHAHPAIWPFSAPFKGYYTTQARPLPLPVYPGAAASSAPLSSHLKVHSIFIYNDPRDWGLDTTLIVDLLLSHGGYLGTRSELNGSEHLPNKGYQQDGQPMLYFSNPDLWWAASWHLSRLGQGGFREALEGVWRATTGGAELHKVVGGKPSQGAYEYAEKRLVKAAERMAEDESVMVDEGGETETKRDGKLHEQTGLVKRVYMVGDNPASDIAGANNYRSPRGSEWSSILVKSGVYEGGEPSEKPAVVVDDVWDAVKWAVKREGRELELDMTQSLKAKDVWSEGRVKGKDEEGEHDRYG